MGRPTLPPENGDGVALLLKSSLIAIPEMNDAKRLNFGKLLPRWRARYSNKVEQFGASRINKQASVLLFGSRAQALDIPTPLF